jgi:hypothetical protein
MRIKLGWLLGLASVLVGNSAHAGVYDLQSTYNLRVQDTRGWLIEWKLAQVVNRYDNTNLVPGSWYYNLEIGIYGGWGGFGVYYFGDDNGVAGNEAKCPLVWDSGGICGQEFTNLSAGRKVTLKYEWCNPDRTASVNGPQLCAWVDLQDEKGWRFLAMDARSATAEMYSHDVEHFTDQGGLLPQVSCKTPT